jgi:hypothetical protein
VRLRKEGQGRREQGRGREEGRDREEAGRLMELVGFTEDELPWVVGAAALRARGRRGCSVSA